MNKEEILKLTEQYVKKCMEDKEPGHDFLHVVRVRKNSLFLAKHVGGDLFLVEMLALLHDIEDHKFDDNNKVSAFLDTLDISSNYKKEILDILPYLSFSKYPKLEDDFPIEGKIIQDADRIDALGAIGVARAFSYGGNKNRRMYGSNDSTLQHFDDKLLILDQYLYFDISKDIASRRVKYLKEFYKEFLEEINEEYIGEKL